MKGRVKVDGDVFMARSADGMPISEGTDVKIVKVDSTILVVRPLDVVPM